MRTAITLSGLFHVAVFAVAYFGLPGFKPLPILTETPIMVELVEVSDVTRAPPRTRAPEPKKKPTPKEPEKKAEKPAHKPQPKPQPIKQAETPPPPAPPAPEPEAVAIAPPAPEPKPQAKKKPEPKKPTETKPKPSPVLAQAKPQRKPKPVDAFDSVFKTVQKLKTETPPPPREEPAKKKDDFQAQIAQALQSKSSAPDVADKLTISEIDLVRQQIRKCWNVQGGYKDIENLSVMIRVQMNPDGTVRQAQIENAGSFARDPFHKAFAESAYRAVLNKRCQPFKLPPEKYGHWKTMTLNFDPRDML